MGKRFRQLVRIRDSLGNMFGGMKLHYLFPKLILRGKPAIEQNNSMHLSFSGQEAGIYFLKIKTINTEFTIPTIKF
jgi:hypothetical protein